MNSKNSINPLWSTSIILKHASAKIFVKSSFGKLLPTTLQTAFKTIEKVFYNSTLSKFIDESKSNNLNKNIALLSKGSPQNNTNVTKLS